MSTNIKEDTSNNLTETPCTCRVCGGELDARFQKSAKPNNDVYLILTCWNPACALAKYTFTSITYSTMDLGPYLVKEIEMTAQPIPASAPVNYIHDMIEGPNHDEFGYFLEVDAELQDAYLACMKAANLEWTDESLAEAVFSEANNGNVSDLVQYSQWQQALHDPQHPDHQYVMSVHRAREHFMANREE